MTKRRHKPGGIPVVPVVFAAILVGVAGWWLMPDSGVPDVVTAANENRSAAADSQPAVSPLSSDAPLTTDRPDHDPTPPPNPEVSEKGAEPETAPERDTSPSAGASPRLARLIQSGDRALANGDILEARKHYNQALAMRPSDPEGTRIRGELTRIADQAIFSPRILENDSYTERYVVRAGDTLGKIAKRYDVSAECLARINNIDNVNLIRLGQGLKVLKGPFHARVNKNDFGMDVYLGDLFVRHFKVGLGLDGSTPTGEWRVGTKLKNPTYYPPRGGKIVAADDPENPLGERWIALEGISGEAVGQRRYGIHGTIEPESIGRNMSLGCIRLYNEDVELLYAWLVPEKSTVTIEK